MRPASSLTHLRLSRTPRRAASGIAAALALALTAAMGASISTVDPAAAVPGGPPSVFDPASVSWHSYRSQTSDAFAKTFKKRKAASILVDLEIDTHDGYRVGSVWQGNLDGRAWREKRNLTNGKYKAYWKKAKADRMRPIEQETYLVNGKRRYAGIWIRNVEGFAWASHRAQKRAAFLNSVADHRAQGLIPVDIDQYRTSKGTRYASVWVRSQVRDWQIHRNLTKQQWSNTFKSLPGYRVLSFDSLRTPQGQRYAGIFVTNDNGREVRFRRDMSAKGYTNVWYRYRDQGFRLVGLDVYDTKKGTRYAAMWRQNSARPDWSLRSEVDDLVSEELSSTGVPGIAVGIYVNGVATYLRGFGDADINDGWWMDSGHIGPIASVSKAVGGVLTMRMVEDGLLNLGDDTRSLVSGMPAHQTHTVGQLLSNRGCVRHYASGQDGFADKTYSTARKASEEFWDDALICNPANVAYNYSTHGYTFLGAALEGAGNDDIKGLVRKRLTKPFGLGVLGPQRSAGHRMTLYNSGTNEFSEPNNDWKVLGGGLESSAAHLASFGAKLVGGSILTPTSLTAMWTPPDGASNYAYGWSTGTESGTQVAAKDGSWVGSLAYLRLYPEYGISVAVIMNSRSGDQSATALGRSIGSVVLGEAID